MTKENAEKFYAMYQQHKAIAKNLAGLDGSSEAAFLAGLAKIAESIGLECTQEEIRSVLKSANVGNESLDALSGGFGDKCEIISCVGPKDGFQSGIKW